MKSLLAHRVPIELLLCRKRSILDLINPEGGNIYGSWKKEVKIRGSNNIFSVLQLLKRREL